MYNILNLTCKVYTHVHPSKGNYNKDAEIKKLIKYLLLFLGLKPTSPQLKSLKQKEM